MKEEVVYEEMRRSSGPASSSEIWPQQKTMPRPKKKQKTPEEEEVTPPPDSEREWIQPKKMPVAPRGPPSAQLLLNQEPLPSSSGSGSKKQKARHACKFWRWGNCEQGSWCLWPHPPEEFNRKYQERADFTPCKYFFSMNTRSEGCKPLKGGQHVALGPMTPYPYPCPCPCPCPYPYPYLIYNMLRGFPTQ